MWRKFGSYRSQSLPVTETSNSPPCLAARCLLVWLQAVLGLGRYTDRRESEFGGLSSSGEMGTKVIWHFPRNKQHLTVWKSVASAACTPRLPQVLWQPVKDNQNQTVAPFSPGQTRNVSDRTQRVPFTLKYPQDATTSQHI